MPTTHKSHRDTFPQTNTDKIVGGSTLLAELRDRIRLKHYSIRTEQAYLGWVKRYILFHGKRHPSEMAEPEIVAFLNHLAVERTFPPRPRIKHSTHLSFSTSRSWVAKN